MSSRTLIGGDIQPVEDDILISVLNTALDIFGLTDH
jgi:hypothetical protein